MAPPIDPASQARRYIAAALETREGRAALTATTELLITRDMMDIFSHTTPQDLRAIATALRAELHRRAP